MSPERRRRLAQLGRWHHEWATRTLPDAQYRPAEHPKPGSDYSQHYVDLGADAAAEDEFHRRARRILGLDDPPPPARPGQ